MLVHFTLFTSRLDNQGNRVEMPWDSFVTRFSQSTETDCLPCKSLTGEGKCGARDVGTWSPSIFNRVRSNDTFESSDLLVFDLDHKTRAEIGAIDEELDASGLTYLVHTTHSHNPSKNDWCLRLVIPLSRPVDRAEFKRVRTSIEHKLKLGSDPQAKDWARIYFLPSHPKGTKPFALAIKGKVADPSAFATVQVSPAAPVQGTQNLGGLKETLAKNALLKSTMAGENIVKAGGRDSSLTSLMGVAAVLAPDAIPEAVVELLLPSLSKWEPDDGPSWPEKALEKFTRFSAVKREENKSRAEAVAAVSEVSAKHATLATNPLDAGKTPASIREWIISTKDTFWVFSGGRYKRPVTSKDLRVSLSRDWAVDLPAAFYADEKTGEMKLLASNVLLERFSTVARNVISDLALRESYYDPEEQTFYEAVCPVKPFAAEYSPVVQALLENLVDKSQTEKLIDWVASVARLDLPCCALFLSGARGVGKSLLAYGLARLWGSSPTSFEMGLADSFNDALTQCPLVFADEGLPTNGHHDIMSLLRRAIGSPSRKLNRKFLAPTELRGNIRIVVAANNSHTGKHNIPMDREDISAVSERVLFCTVRAEARDYLQDLKDAGFDVNSLVKDNLIAKHALWLAAQRPVQSRGRFLVSGDESEFSTSLVSKNGSCPVVLEFLVRMLSSDALPNDKTYSIGKGQLTVSPNLISNPAHWSTYVPSQRIPGAAAISSALRQLSTSQAELEGSYFYRINLVALYRAVEDLGICTPDKIRARIEAP